jgi:hypothetical protein
MSKSVLVIDTPESCRECNFRKYNEFGRCYVCAAKNNYMIDRDVNIDIIPYWCPLSPLPEKISLHKFIGKAAFDNNMATMMGRQYTQGYNSCLDDILKGENK